MNSNDLLWPQMTFYRVLLIICFRTSPISAMFEEKPDFSTSDLHELHDRKLRNQFVIEQNRECQYYFWDHFTQENYFVWVREAFHKSRIPTKLNLDMIETPSLPLKLIWLRRLDPGHHHCKLWFKRLKLILSIISVSIELVWRSHIICDILNA